MNFVEAVESMGYGDEITRPELPGYVFRSKDTRLIYTYGQYIGVDFDVLSVDDVDKNPAFYNHDDWEVYNPKEERKQGTISQRVGHFDLDQWIEDAWSNTYDSREETGSETRDWRDSPCCR